MAKPDYYTLLGVTWTADGEAVKKAYRQRAFELHPDRNPAPEAAERFKEIGEAYATLSDDAKRTAYNRMLLEAAFSRTSFGIGRAPWPPDWPTAGRAAATPQGKRPPATPPGGYAPPKHARSPRRTPAERRHARMERQAETRRTRLEQVKRRAEERRRRAQGRLQQVRDRLEVRRREAQARRQRAAGRQTTGEGQALLEMLADLLAGRTGRSTHRSGRRRS
jgi:curved DNA-binding protein CbpA